MPFDRCHEFIVRQSLFCIVSMLPGSYCLHAQMPDTGLFQQKINQYNVAHPKQVLFIQTDKTLYTNNETVWFAAYLLQDIKDNLLKADILTVAVVEESSRKTAIQKKYLLENGLCPGSLLLPDSIMPGNYELLAFTNLVNKAGAPLAVFRQPMTIKSTKSLPFSTNFTMDTLFTQDTLRIDVKVVLPGVGTGLASFASIDYHLQQEQPVTLKLDVYGRGRILMPRNKIKRPGQVLFTTTRYKSERQYFNLQLPGPVQEDSINVLFYPEGGDLVDGLQSRVAWEAKTSFGAPVQVTALLIKDGKISDTLRSNSYGTGMLSILPGNDSRYVVRLLSDNRKLRWKDFLLPVSLHKGVVLEIKNAIAADTLNVTIKTNVNPWVRIAITNMNQVTISAKVEINRERNIRLPLNKISKGINTITIVDDKGRPLAERVFFAHFDKNVSAAIQTDKPAYKIRDKVNLHIQLIDADSAGTSGLFTVACTQNNRIEPLKQRDIETYYYMGELFDELPLYTAGRAYGNEKFMEDVLLLKGWRRYTWQNIMQTDNQDTTDMIQKLVLKGQVFRNKKILKKSVELIMMRDTLFESFTTDAKGAFIMDPSAITVAENRKMFLKVSGENAYGYSIVSSDTLEKTMLQQAGRFSVASLLKPLFLQTPIQQIIADQPKVKTLQEVVIRAQKDNALFSKKTNACGDYVCEYHVLNCRNHPWPFEIPVKGKFYLTNNSGTVYVVYTGCVIASDPSVTEVSDIYTAREFYGMDSMLLQQIDPEYMSTICWKPFVLADAKGQVNLSFYTSDIKGDFRITVQGIGSNGEPFYSEQRIRVE
ncbi:MAG: hypothetical protein ABIQ88_06850 [Chitinophagaceae bacterium]